MLQRSSVVIPNPVDGERFLRGVPSEESRTEVLWIGRYDRHHKRPHLVLEVAQLCPNIPFHLVINRSDPQVEREIRSSCPANVRISDYIPGNEIPSAFRAARLFLSTGSNAFEGFPNVLLEAAASGTPIVSLEDFDGFLSDSNAGVATGNDTALLAARVRELWEMPTAWHVHSRSGAEYVRRQHSLPACVSAFLRAIRTPQPPK